MATRRHVALLSFVALVAPARVAYAEEAPLWLSVSAPDGCIDAAAVARAVEEIAPSDARARAAYRLEVDARGGDPPRYVMAIARADGEGARTLEASTCAALSDAAVAVLALSSPVEAPAARVPPPARPAAAEAPPEAPEDDRALAAPRALPPWQLRLGVSGGVEGGQLPSAMALVSGRVGVSLGRWLAELELAGGPQQRVEVAPGRGASLASLGGGARAAYLFGDRAFAVGPYLGAGVGSVSGAGYGTATVSEGSALWATFGAGALATAQIAPHVRLRADVGASVPTSRPSYVLLAVGEVHRPAAVSGRATLGVDVELF